MSPKEIFERKQKIYLRKDPHYDDISDPETLQASEMTRGEVIGKW